MRPHASKQCRNARGGSHAAREEAQTTETAQPHPWTAKVGPHLLLTPPFPNRRNPHLMLLLNRRRCFVVAPRSNAHPLDDKGSESSGPVSGSRLDRRGPHGAVSPSSRRRILSPRQQSDCCPLRRDGARGRRTSAGREGEATIPPARRDRAAPAAGHAARCGRRTLDTCSYFLSVLTRPSRRSTRLTRPTSGCTGTPKCSRSAHLASSANA